MSIVDSIKTTLTATVYLDEEYTDKLKRIAEYDHSENVNRSFRAAINMAIKFLNEQEELKSESEN